MTVYVAMFVLLKTENAAAVLSVFGGRTGGRLSLLGNPADFGPDDVPSFKILAFVTLAIGAVATLAFHLGLHSARQYGEQQS